MIELKYEDDVVFAKSIGTLVYREINDDVSILTNSLMIYPRNRGSRGHLLLNVTING